MPTRTFDPIPTRHSLLQRLKDWGDQSSWQEFFDTYSELIYNVAVKAGLSDVEAQEVVQETVIGVARKIGEFKADPAHGSFSAWLMQLTRWRIADQRRKRQRDGSSPADFSEVRTGPYHDDSGSTDAVERIPDPEGVRLDTLWREEWEKVLMATALERVKRRVSARQFQLFDLHVLQKVPVRKTASILRESAASVYMAKYRVGRLLKEEISKLEKERI